MSNTDSSLVRLSILRVGGRDVFTGRCNIKGLPLPSSKLYNPANRFNQWTPGLTDKAISWRAPSGAQHHWSIPETSAAISQAESGICLNRWKDCGGLCTHLVIFLLPSMLITFGFWNPWQSVIHLPFRDSADALNADWLQQSMLQFLLQTIPCINRRWLQTNIFKTLNRSSGLTHVEAFNTPRTPL